MSSYHPGKVRSTDTTDRLTDRQTDGRMNRPTDICKAIYPHFVEGRHKYLDTEKLYDENITRITTSITNLYAFMHTTHIHGNHKKTWCGNNVLYITTLVSNAI